MKLRITLNTAQESFFFLGKNINLSEENPVVVLNNVDKETLKVLQKAVQMNQIVMTSLVDEELQTPTQDLFEIINNATRPGVLVQLIFQQKNSSKPNDEVIKAATDKLQSLKKKPINNIGNDIKIGPIATGNRLEDRIANELLIEDSNDQEVKLEYNFNKSI